MSKMSKIYITSDFHFFHENIMTYCDRYSPRFGSIIEYQNALVEYLADLLGENDILFFLGDLALSAQKSVAGCKDLLAKIKCKNMHFVRGNHDKWLQNADIYECGFKSIREYLLLGETLFCHYPLDGPFGEYGNYKLHKHLWDMFYQNPLIKKVIHGHIHNAALKPRLNVEYINVCVDKNKDKFNVLEFTEVAYADFKAILESKKDAFKFSEKTQKFVPFEMNFAGNYNKKSESIAKQIKSIKSKI